MKLKKCPVCDETYIHPREVLYIPDTDRGEGVPVSISSVRGVGETRVVIGTEPVSSSTRGSELHQSFACEAGHLWVEVSSFHKGNIHEKLTRLLTVNEDSEVEAFECLDAVPYKTTA